MLKKRGSKGQVGVEYMIVIGFVTLAIMSVLALAYFYSDEIKGNIKLNQVESFASQLIGKAESVFFAGEPSKNTVELYLPENVESLEIRNDGILITTNIGLEKSVRLFKSKVPLSGTITPTLGLKKISLEAREGDVLVTVI
ncbi:MAG: hypothetical protein KKB31_02825 [Nanoarchaeota archaeon]|nr:hypothetical protein [Nanoarchaeota archaeon]